MGNISKKMAKCKNEGKPLIKKPKYKFCKSKEAKTKIFEATISLAVSERTEMSDPDLKIAVDKCTKQYQLLSQSPASFSLCSTEAAGENIKLSACEEVTPRTSHKVTQGNLAATSRAQISFENSQHVGSPTRGNNGDNNEDDENSNTTDSFVFPHSQLPAPNDLGLAVGEGPSTSLHTPPTNGGGKKSEKLKHLIDHCKKLHSEASVRHEIENFQPQASRPTPASTPDSQSHPDTWEKSFRAEMAELQLNTRARELVPACCSTFMSHPISRDANLRDTHDMSYNYYREQSKIDFSILKNIKQEEGENAGEFITKFKGQFDRHSGMPRGQPGYQQLLNHLLMEAIRPHLKQAIILHLWKTKTLDELTALVTYYDDYTTEPTSRQPTQGQEPPGNPPHTQNNNRPSGGGYRNKRDPSRVTCWNCGEKGHTVHKCPQPIEQPFAFFP